DRFSLKYNPYGMEYGGIPRWYVNDLKIQFAYDRKSGDGPLRTSLTKRSDTFVAEFMPNIARLFHLTAGGEQRQIGPDIMLDGSPVNVEFQNVDYQVTLRLNGRDVIQTTPDDYRPDVQEVLNLYTEYMHRADDSKRPEEIRRTFGVPRVELSAQRQTCDIAHLSLWRDVYYTPTFDDYTTRLRQGSPEHPIKILARGEGSPDQENEYFVLGDNSILSSDGRAWGNEVWLQDEENLKVEAGKVPERFLLGQAFFVYWPAGYRPFGQDAPGLIPNFGAMRFIH